MILITLLTFLGVLYIMQLISIIVDVYVYNSKMTIWAFIKRLIPFYNIKRTLTPYWYR